TKHLSGEKDRFEVEHRVKAKDGDWRRILSKGRIIARAADHTPLRAAGTHLDVTATREFERQAAEALRELQLVTDAIPMMIAQIDAQEHLRFANRACETSLGRSLSEVLGMHLRDVFDAPTYHKLQPLIATALLGDPVQFEELITLPDSTCWWLVHLLPHK